MSFREQYWRYSLVALILLLGIIIFLNITPFLGGFLGASTLYVLLRSQMFYLTEKRHWRPSWAALAMLIETMLLFLIPISLIVWLLISKIQAVNLNPTAWILPAEHLADFIQEKTGYDVLSKGNITSLISILPKVGQVLMGREYREFWSECTGFTSGALFYVCRRTEDGGLYQGYFTF